MIDPVWKNDSKNWTLFWIWLKESNSKKKIKNLNSFQKKKNDSKNWTFFECNSKSWIFWVWLEERNFFFFFKKWLKELKSLEHDSKNFFFWMWLKELNFWVCQKKKRLKELSFSQKYDTKNWTSFQYVSKIFFNMTRRIEPFFITWFKDLVFSHQKKNSKIFFKTHRLEPFKKYFQKKKNDSKNWFFLNFIHRIEHLFRIQLTELNAFFNMTHRNWTLFSTWLIEIEPIFLNVILSGKMTQRIEPFCFFQQWLKWLNSL